MYKVVSDTCIKCAIYAETTSVTRLSMELRLKNYILTCRMYHNYTYIVHVYMYNYVLHAPFHYVQQSKG